MRYASVLLAALALAACSSTSVPAPVDMNLGCQSNADCKASPTGHVCTGAHACVVCATDGDCGTGRKCDNQMACVDCLAGGDCAPGTKCVAKSCAPGCDDKNPCATGLVCDATLGACVECAADSDCATHTGMATCDLASHKCVGCTSDDGCPAGKVCRAHACTTGCDGTHPACPTGQTCNLAAGACVQCLGDGDCKSPNTPRCDVGSNTCVACLAANDNCAAGTFCAANACVAGCKSDGDCAGSSSGGSDGGAPSGGTQCNLATHQCVQCVSDAACPAGQVCAANACVPGCSAQHACPGGQGCCGGACVDIFHDAANCGGCGNACATGSGCCGGQCISLATVDNCGACGAACADVANGTRACSASTCGIGLCDGTYADCDKSAANGCEVNTATDGSNCGACGTTCTPLPNAAPGCAGGHCALGVCNTGFADCDVKPQNGCEVNLKTDGNNCGTCGNFCPPVANGTGGCTSGACAIGSCNTGFKDCDGNAKTGCEVNIQNDPSNCGGCGTVCPSNLPNCLAGKCVVADPCLNYGGTQITLSANVKVCKTNLTWGAWNPSLIPSPWQVCTLSQWMQYAPSGSPSSFGLQTIWINNNTCPTGNPQPNQHHEVYVGYAMNDANCYNGVNCCWSDSTSLQFAVCQP